MKHFVLHGQLYEFVRPEVLEEKHVREATEAEVEFYNQIVKSVKQRDKIWDLMRSVQDILLGNRQLEE